MQIGMRVRLGLQRRVKMLPDRHAQYGEPDMIEVNRCDQPGNPSLSIVLSPT